MLLKSASKTSLALTDWQQYIYSNIDYCRAVASTFVDYRKAPDRFDLKIFIRKFYAYVLGGDAMKRLKSYSMDREQYTYH